MFTKFKGTMNHDYSRIAISGAGFLADAYDLFVINIAVDLMDRCDYHQPLTSQSKASIKALALAGAVVGQLGFGAIADLIGRRTVFIITCALVMLGALMSATVVDSSAGIFNQLCFWRFILGVGVGGEYPLSASITSESSDDEEKARNLAMVFCMQGIGTVLCSLVLVIITSSFNYSNYDAQWRIALGLGGLPMAIAFYFRWKMHETSWKEESRVYRKEAQLNRAGDEGSGVEEQGMDFSRVRNYFVTGWKYWWHVVSKNAFLLAGTAGAWFLLDVVFYANGLFSGEVVRILRVASNPKQESVATLYLQLLALPGYFFSIKFAEQIGLLRLQLFSFVIIAVLFIFLAILQPYLVQIPVLYVILYGLTFFFQNFGANATTYIIPSIIYTSAERATCHGVSSAAGKLGAMFGTFVFLFMTDIFCKGNNCKDDDSSETARTQGLQLTFGLCGIVAIIGWMWTYYFGSDQPATSLLSEARVTANQSKKQYRSPVDLENEEEEQDETMTVKLYEMIDLQSSMSQHSLLAPSHRKIIEDENEDVPDGRSLEKIAHKQTRDLEKSEDKVRASASERRVDIGDEESYNPLLTERDNRSPTPSQTVENSSSAKSSSRPSNKKKSSSKSKSSNKKKSDKKYRVDYDDDEMAL